MSKHSIAQNGVIYSSQPITSVQVFGDSIAAGVGATSTPNRWSTLFCASIGATENNFAVSGSQWVSGSTTTVGIYNNSASTVNRLTVLAFGTNDAAIQPAQFDQVGFCILNAILYNSLPPSSIKSPRTTGTTTGTWTNTSVYTNTGITTAAIAIAGATYSISLTGRFIAFATTIFASSNTSYVQFTITIDGSVLPTSNGWPIIDTLVGAGGFYSSFGYILDLGVAAAGLSHTIIFTPTTVGSPANAAFFLDWTAGFDFQPAGCCPVIVPDFGLRATANTGTQGTVQNEWTLRLQTQRICEEVASLTGLPIFYFPGMYRIPSFIHLDYDELHPNNYGHALIAARAKQMLG